jgi:hemerythrin
VTLITWSSACTIGVKAMDDQHGILMDTMNELRLTLVRGNDRKQIDEQFERLIEFTRMHFKSEEQLLEQHGFPGLLEHRAAHRLLMDQIMKTIDRAEHAEYAEIHSLLCFLRNWYLDHIEQVDQEYGAWLNERGVY